MKIESKYSVSKSNLDIFFMKYSDKFVFFSIIVFYAWRYFVGDFWKFFPALPVLLFVMLLPIISFRNFAYKISIDLKKNEIVFLMARKKDPIYFKIDDIKDISVNFHITFKLNRKKIIFSKASDKQFLSFLARIKPVNYKFFGRIAQRYF